MSKQWDPYQAKLYKATRRTERVVPATNFQPRSRERKLRVQYLEYILLRQPAAEKQHLSNTKRHNQQKILIKTNFGFIGHRGGLRGRIQRNKMNYQTTDDVENNAMIIIAGLTSCQGCELRFRKWLLILLYTLNNKAIIWYGKSACLNDAYSRIGYCEVENRISSGCHKVGFAPRSLRNYETSRNLPAIITVQNASKKILYLNALQINQRKQQSDRTNKEIV